MSVSSAKKILLAASVLILLIAIPIIIYLLSQQKPKTEVASTTLTFVPATQSANANDNVSVDVSMDPGTNSISIVKLLIAYDATKLATTEGGFAPNTSSFPSVVSGPSYEEGTIAVTLSVGANSPAIQTTTKVASITFKALEPTDTAPTQLTFNTQTQVLSSTGTNQDVLSSAAPATVNISAAAEIPTPFPTTSDSLIPTPTTSGQELSVATAGQTGPVCISFTADRPTTGTAPFNVNFTLIATSSAAVIEKATFDFGDGGKKDLTSVDGLGENPTTVNALTSHIYSSAGTFTARGSITDVNGNVSDSGTCTLVFNISSEGGQTATQTAGLTPAPSPLPPTGSSSFTAILVISLIIVFVGAALLLAL